MGRPSAPLGVRRGWLFPLALLLQLGAVHGQAIMLVGAVQPWLLGVSYLLLLAGALSNLRLWGFRLFLLGVALNFLAIGLNGWHMPISPEALARAGFVEQAALESGSELPSSKAVVMYRQETRVWPLTDIVPVTTPLRRVVSVGDLVIWAAVPIIMAEVVLRRRPLSKARKVRSNDTADVRLSFPP